MGVKSLVLRDPRQHPGKPSMGAEQMVECVRRKGTGSCTSFPNGVIPVIKLYFTTRSQTGPLATPFPLLTVPFIQRCT